MKTQAKRKKTKVFHYGKRARSVDLEESRAGGVGRVGGGHPQKLSSRAPPSTGLRLKPPQKAASGRKMRNLLSGIAVKIP